jgi:hypothetical protein
VTARHPRWLTLIQVAPTDEEVLVLVRKYLGTLSDLEFSRLPERCRPTLPRDREDVSGWAVELVKADMKFTGSPDATELLHQMATIFSGASTRFAQLAQEAKSLGPPSQQ